MADGKFYYLTRRADFDDSLEHANLFASTSIVGLTRLIWRQRPTIIELPEPMWFKYFIPLMVVVITARLRGIGASRIRLVTYAIENTTTDRLPRPLRRVKFPLFLWKLTARHATRLVLRSLDRIAFGTAGARQALVGTVDAAWYSRLGLQESIFEALPQKCDCEISEPIPGHVVFLGDLDPRKGFDLLVNAWPKVLETTAGRSNLTIAGSGSLEDLARSFSAVSDNHVDFVGVIDRKSVHRLMRTASVVVLPSQPSFRWREQVGLPIVEALAHGVAIVTTDETGLSDWLQRNGASVLNVPTSPNALAASISASLAQREAPRYRLPLVDQRLAADDWLVSLTH